MPKKAIGGYLGLELSLNQKGEYHSSAIALNSGRNALLYILEESAVNHIYIPYYTCQAVLEPIKKTGIKYSFYRLDKNLEIMGLKDFESTSHVLYINYFGLKGRYVKKMAKQVNNLIVDNSQAFYDTPLDGIKTFYSPRKFFGVPGGGYVCGIAQKNKKLNRDISHDRSNHLFIRLDKGAEAGYEKFQENEKKMAKRPLRRMSLLTKRILGSLNYERIEKQRILNYQTLHNKLADKNELFDLASLPYGCPLIYPFKNNAISKSNLIDHKIYVPQYWPNVDLSSLTDNAIEYTLTNNLIALPVDQRYNKEDMFKIIKVIEKYGQ